MARSCAAIGLTGHPNWMRLHEVHRIERAKSMAGVSHSRELIGVKLEHDGVKLNRRPSPAHLAPLAGRGRIASAMPTGRANARPMTGSASSGAIRVRGSHRAHLCSEFAEAAPHPNPLPAKSGERVTANVLPYRGGAMPGGGGGSDAVPPLSKGVMRRMVPRRLIRLGPEVCSFWYCGPESCEGTFFEGAWDCYVRHPAADSGRGPDH